jgi:hypothetical protein
MSCSALGWRPALALMLAWALGTAAGCGSTSGDDVPVYQPEWRGAPRAESSSRTAEVVLERADAPPVRVRVEVVVEERDRRRGLQFRRYLGPRSGMLFVFEGMEVREFWMENTFIALDVLFIDDQFQVVGIVEETEPLSRDDITVDRPAQYVLEIRSGFVRTHGLAVGDQARFVGVFEPGR